MGRSVQGRAMSRKRRSSKKTSAPVLHSLNPNAAGVDIGATEVYIAVPADRDPQLVRQRHLHQTIPIFIWRLGGAVGVSQCASAAAPNPDCFAEKQRPP